MQLAILSKSQRLLDLIQDSYDKIQESLINLSINMVCFNLGFAFATGDIVEVYVTHNEHLSLTAYVAVPVNLLVTCVVCNKRYQS